MMSRARAYIEDQTSIVWSGLVDDSSYFEVILYFAEHQVVVYAYIKVIIYLGSFLHNKLRCRFEPLFNTHVAIGKIGCNYHGYRE